MIAFELQETRPLVLDAKFPVTALALSALLLGAGSAAAQNAPAPAASSAKPKTAASHKAAPHKKPTKPAAGKRGAVQKDGTPDVVTYGQREDVVRLGRSLAEQQGLDADWVLAQLAQARYQPSVARLVMPPAAGVAKNWQAYRARFVEPQRLREGQRWWQDHERWLDLAEARWGVPASVIVAIVGIETFYGRQTGGYKVIDALATLSFDFPSGRSDRTPFYRDELAAFLRWCNQEKRDPQSVRGSYAGAIGLPQFMPSSIQKYAVDFDGDGRIDLDTHGADVVGSVAHYLAEFGWQRGLPTHFGVAPPVSVSDRATLLSPDILPSFSAKQMGDLGAQLDPAGQAYDGPLALVELQNGDNAPSYVAGTRNFYVITRYNWSSYYALAVIELARTLRQMRPPAPIPSPAASLPGA